MKETEQYTVKGGRRLRRGYTTGTCAAAASLAAARLLLSGETPAMVEVKTPSGAKLCLVVEFCRYEREGATCAVRKDAGDDPDVTGGILIYATVTRIPGGTVIDGGEGIGRVTRRGLPCAVGEAAINPVPRRMIADALESALRQSGSAGGLKAVIWTPQGAEIAKRTFNERLGILGGISILGTSGIVEPMSEAALVASIRAEIDVRREVGHRLLLLAPGNYGQAYARETWGIGLDQGVKCSNFIGEALDYAFYKGFSGVILLGHAGKLIKLAAGIMNTHSAVADGRMEVLACHSALTGLEATRVRRLFGCLSVEEADGLLRGWGEAERVWQSIGERVRYHLEHRRAGSGQAAFGAFLTAGTVMQSGNLTELLEQFGEQEWSV